jgi:hypothetical protein
MPAMPTATMRAIIAPQTSVEISGVDWNNFDMLSMTGVNIVSALKLFENYLKIMRGSFVEIDLTVLTVLSLIFPKLRKSLTIFPFLRRGRCKEVN